MMILIDLISQIICTFNKIYDNGNVIAIEQRINDPKSSTNLLNQNENALEQIQSRIRENVTLKYQTKSPTEANLIMTCLKNHFVFYNLSDGELENIRDKMLLA